MPILCRSDVFLWLFSLLSMGTVLISDVFNAIGKIRGIRGLEMQKLDCKMILESVNNTKMKCTSIRVLYIFKCHSEQSNSSVHGVLCDWIWIGASWPRRELIFFLCHYFLCVCFEFFSWRNTIIPFFYFFIFFQYFLTVLYYHNANSSCHPKLELWKTVSTHQSNQCLSFLII